MLVVEKLEGCARGLEKEDHEERDETEPEFAGPQFARATGANLHEERPPGEEKQNDRQAEGDQVTCDVEIVRARLPITSFVHANLQKYKRQYSVDRLDSSQSSIL